jgi:tRNA-2-methylthio-N6-dimethylallyladenosine synthase
MNLQNTQSLAWRQKMLGKIYEVLVEGPSKSNPERLTGRTRGNELVVFTGDPLLTGSLVQVKMLEARSWTLLGEII